MMLKGKDFLTLKDFSSEEILAILKLSRRMKDSRNLFKDILEDKSIALIFEKPSTRTRISIHVAVSELGGTVVELRPSEMQLSRGESLADTARVLSRYIDLVVVRMLNYGSMEELARWADIPIVNALSNLNHPLQTLADLLTIWEYLGKLRGVKVAWIGDGNNVCNSLLIGASKLGLDLSIASPKGYEPDENFLRLALKYSEETGASIELLEDPEDAVKNADVVMTDTFVSMGMEEELEDRIRVFLPRYRVDAHLMSKAKPNAIFMHPLPAYRGREVTDEVIDGPRSAVWDQAENRLHTAKALLAMLLSEID